MAEERREIKKKLQLWFQVLDLDLLLNVPGGAPVEKLLHPIVRRKEELERGKSILQTVDMCVFVSMALCVRVSSNY